jgi:hypothetical protein
MWNSNLVSPNQIPGFAVTLKKTLTPGGLVFISQRMRIVPEPGIAAQSALPLNLTGSH